MSFHFPAMCDYSLQNVRSQPAKVGDKLTARDFGTGTHGFAAVEDATVAVSRIEFSERTPGGAILRHMKVKEIAEVVAKLPPDQLARFRRWFTAFEAGRSDHAKELDSTVTKLGRLAGRAFAELKKRAKEP
jgi:hypothetical protein